MLRKKERSPRPQERGGIKKPGGNMSRCKISLVILLIGTFIQIVFSGQDSLTTLIYPNLYDDNDTIYINRDMAYISNIILADVSDSARELTSYRVSLNHIILDKVNDTLYNLLYDYPIQNNPEVIDLQISYRYEKDHITVDTTATIRVYLLKKPDVTIINSKPSNRNSSACESRYTNTTSGKNNEIGILLNGRKANKKLNNNYNIYRVYYIKNR